MTHIPQKKFSLIHKLTYDAYRYRFQMIVVPVLLGAVATVMSLFDCFSGERSLTVVTAAFAGVCLICAFLNYLNQKNLLLSDCIFAIGIFVLCFYFLVLGGPDAFCPVWICLLPACGMLLFGLYPGILISGAMFAGVIFLLWTEAGNRLLLCRYTVAFRQRFPLVYAAFFLIGLFFEIVRKHTHDQLEQNRQQYRDLSVRDALTGINNRLWFNARTTDAFYRHQGFPISLIMIDIDLFKQFNDTYGHPFGDRILIRISEKLTEVAGKRGQPCRWGGEEFAILLENCPLVEALGCAERLHEEIGKTVFLGDHGEKLHITISVGVAEATDCSTDAAALVAHADAALYQAKENGRNCVIPYFNAPSAYVQM